MFWLVPTRSVRRWLLAAALAAPSGCAWDRYALFKPPTPPPPPVDNFVLRPEGFTPEKAPAEGSPEAMLAGGHELFRQQEYAKAARVYHWLAEHDKNPPAIVQEAMFYEAESLRLQGYYPAAGDLFASLNEKFRNNPYRDVANQRMFDIALFWLDDTWAEMRESEERRQGKRWVVWPRFVSLEKKKPLLDREGRALQLLDKVRFNDLKGPLDDKALFVCGHVKLYNEDYKEADQYFTQLHELHPNSPFDGQAVELAIFSKQMSTGGPEYDGRKCAEARQLVDVALRSPGVDDKKKQALTNQIRSITAQQAAKDFDMADFYRRTGHPGAAYYYYKIVARRYPNTDFARQAEERAAQLEVELRGKGEERRRPEEAQGPGTAPAPQQAPQTGGGASASGPPRGLPSGIDR